MVIYLPCDVGLGAFGPSRGAQHPPKLGPVWTQVWFLAFFSLTERPRHFVWGIGKSIFGRKIFPLQFNPYINKVFFSFDSKIDDQRDLAQLLVTVVGEVRLFSVPLTGWYVSIV